MRNLKAEMARYGVTTNAIGKAIQSTDRTVTNKLNGSSEFTIEEAITIRDSFFPGLRLEYLFAAI